MLKNKNRTEENQDKKSKPVKLDKLGLVSNAEGDNSTSSDKRPKDPGIRFRIGKSELEAVLPYYLNLYLYQKSCT